jgi:predicted transposase YdaD
MTAGFDTLHSTLPEDLMQESVIYQEIIQRGILLGREEVREENRKEGKKEGKLEIIRKQLTRQRQKMTPETQA